MQSNSNPALLNFYRAKQVLICLNIHNIAPSSEQGRSYFSSRRAMLMKTVEPFSGAHCISPSAQIACPCHSYSCSSNVQVRLCSGFMWGHLCRPCGNTTWFQIWQLRPYSPWLPHCHLKHFSPHFFSKIFTGIQSVSRYTSIRGYGSMPVINICLDTDENHEA